MRQKRYRWSRKLKVWNTRVGCWRPLTFHIGTVDTLLSYEIAGTPLARRLLKE